MLNMTNDVNHTIAPRAFGWEPLKIERKKAKGNMMYKILDDMDPLSLTKLFSNKSDKTEYHLRNISSSLCLPRPRTDYMNNTRTVSCMTGQNFGILFPKILGNANLFLPFGKNRCSHL